MAKTVFEQAAEQAATEVLTQETAAALGRRYARGLMKAHVGIPGSKDTAKGAAARILASFESLTSKDRSNGESKSLPTVPSKDTVTTVS
jgi:hypothetical protein